MARQRGRSVYPSVVEPHIYISKPPGLSLSQTLDVFSLLTQTYPRYVDTASRAAVEDLGMRLIEIDESRAANDKLGVMEQVVGWLANEASKVSKSGSFRCAEGDRFFIGNQMLMIPRVRMLQQMPLSY